MERGIAAAPVGDTLRALMPLAEALIAEGPGVEGGGDGFRRGIPPIPLQSPEPIPSPPRDLGRRLASAVAAGRAEALGPRDRSSAANGAWDDAFVAAAQRVAFHLTLATSAAAPGETPPRRRGSRG